MIPKALMRKIRNIEIVTKRLVTNALSGNYESVFKGQGMEFSEVREYQYGDDVRLIDWNVSARQNKPFIKKFKEERDLTVMLLVDVSASLRYATRGETKKELIAEIVALLAFSAIGNSDKVGLILFSDHVEAYLPPRKDKKHILRIIRDVLCFEPKGKCTSLSVALEYMSRVIRKKSVTFLISDFFDSDYQKSLRLAQRRHDLIAIILKDLSEVVLPNCGVLDLEDLETGQMFSVNTDDAKVKAIYQDHYQKVEEERMTIFNRLGIDSIDIMTDESYVDPIVKFLKKRINRK